MKSVPDCGDDVGAHGHVLARVMKRGDPSAEHVDPERTQVLAAAIHTLLHGLDPIEAAVRPHARIRANVLAVAFPDENELALRRDEQAAGGGEATEHAENLPEDG